VRPLVIDIGGSHVKMLAADQTQPRQFDSHEKLSPHQLVERVKELASGWRYDVISIGFPGKVDKEGPVCEPPNLGHGWIRYDFEKAFGCPVRVVNDAALQALGGYDDGRMLFLGLGTGVGSALVTNRVVIPLELGSLPLCEPKPLFERLGREALERDGKTKWLRAVHEAVKHLIEVFDADYIVLGGGNARLVDPLPPGVRLGGNEDAFAGGFRLWEDPVKIHGQRHDAIWQVVC